MMNTRDFNDLLMVVGFVAIGTIIAVTILVNPDAPNIPPVFAHTMSSGSDSYSLLAATNHTRAWNGSVTIAP